MMVSCGGKSSTLITKGDKSKLDTLSYAIGTDIGQGITSQMPEMKFEMKGIVDGAEDALNAKVEKEDKKHDEALDVLQNFFSMERPKRMQTLMAEIAADSRCSHIGSPRVSRMLRPASRRSTETRRISSSRTTSW